jgi:hypothetical protein
MLYAQDPQFRAIDNNIGASSVKWAKVEWAKCRNRCRKMLEYQTILLRQRLWTLEVMRAVDDLAEEAKEFEK